MCTTLDVILKIQSLQKETKWKLSFQQVLSLSPGYNIPQFWHPRDRSCFLASAQEIFVGLHIFKSYLIDIDIFSVAILIIDIWNTPMLGSCLFHLRYLLHVVQWPYGQHWFLLRQTAKSELVTTSIQQGVQSNILQTYINCKCHEEWTWTSAYRQPL